MANNDPLYTTRMITRLRGNRIGLDRNNMLVGPPALKLGVTTGSTVSTATLPAHGVTVLNATAASTFTIDEPITGVMKRLFCNIATSQAVKTAAATFVTTLGSSFRRLTFATSGDGVTLVGISTSQYAVLSLTGAVSMTTTT